jgi:acetyl esterase/lipase
LKVNLSAGFVVAGVSAGGNLAAIMCLMARDYSLSPPLTGQLLIVPAVLSADVVPGEYKPLYQSFVQNANAPVLSAAFVEQSIKAYAPDTSSWKFNPFIHPKGHHNLPPSYFMVCGMDPVRDEGLLYEKRLRGENGVETQLKVYPGLPHSFWTFWPHLEVSKSYYEDVIVGVKWLLGPHASKVN